MDTDEHRYDRWNFGVRWLATALFSAPVLWTISPRRGAHDAKKSTRSVAAKQFQQRRALFGGPHKAILAAAEVRHPPSPSLRRACRRDGVQNGRAGKFRQAKPSSDLNA